MRCVVTLGRIQVLTGASGYLVDMKIDVVSRTVTDVTG
jgi:hypothetical protein